MADKTSIGALATDIEPGAVTTAGTTSAGSVKILWDDDDNLSNILDCLERAKLQMMNYQMKIR